MKSVSIALKDIQLLLKDGGVWVNLFLIPVIFIVIFSGGLAGLAEGDGGDVDLVTLPVVNLDPGGELTRQFIGGLEAGGACRVEIAEQEAAQTALEANEVDRLLTIPAAFSDDVLNGKAVTLKLVNHPNANMSETEAVRLVVAGVAQDLALKQQLVASLEQLGQMRATEPGPADPSEKLCRTLRAHCTKSWRAL